MGRLSMVLPARAAASRPTRDVDNFMTDDGLRPDVLPDEESTVSDRVKHILIGKPLDLRDRSIFHQLSLIPFLAWVGMGADGLSSLSYGPEEAFRALREHTYLAIALALAMAGTVFIISAAYNRIIEAFPHGGGGYVVATKLLGKRAGVVSGCALLVDYILTITVSIAASGDALFSLLSPQWHEYKLLFAAVMIVVLILLNLRGVRESVIVLTPVFLLFILTHAVLVVLGIGSHLDEIPHVAGELRQDFHGGMNALGIGGMLLLFLHAYSLGAGTYTGIEAVSNGLPLLREPRVQNGKRTMVYMATSLALMAGGIIVCYLLLGVQQESGKTMNAVLTETVAREHSLGLGFVTVTLLTEGALLVIAAQAGYIAGPRVLANMAVDSWIPRRFAALSERLTTQNGIIMMGLTSLAALWYTKGDVHTLVVMYSINVFVTFTLSMLAMLKQCLFAPLDAARPHRGLVLFSVGFLLCATILVITIYEKFTEGGWVTIAVTGSVIVLCFLIRRHYEQVQRYLAALDNTLDRMPDSDKQVPAPDPTQPTAAVLVAGYGGLGIHTVLNIFKAFPHYYKNLVFVSVGVTDSGQFKGEKEMAALEAMTKKNLERYVELARRLGVPATYRWTIGTDAVDEADGLCRKVVEEFPKTAFFAGQVVFQLEKWYHALLHNQTAFAVQKRLQLTGLTMVILPVRVRTK